MVLGRHKKTWDRSHNKYKKNFFWEDEKVMIPNTELLSKQYKPNHE